jgi:hypothetical protein
MLDAERRSAFAFYADQAAVVLDRRHGLIRRYERLIESFPGIVYLMSCARTASRRCRST